MRRIKLPILLAFSALFVLALGRIAEVYSEHRHRSPHLGYSRNLKGLRENKVSMNSKGLS